MPSERRAAGERASRRHFFRVVGQRTVSGAGSVLAGVEVLRRSSQDALGELLDDHPAQPRSTDPGRPAAGDRAAEASDAPFRSPYRATASGIEILDQRQLPGGAVTVACSEPSEVAAALRQGLVSGGPVLGPLAAYTAVLAFERALDRPAPARRAALEAAGTTLRSARPNSRALAAALERVDRAAESSEADAPATMLAALRREADRIAEETTGDNALIGRLGAAALSELSGRDQARPVSLLFHGDLGPLVGGQVGPGTALVQALLAQGRSVEVWVTEAAPLLEGQRAAWQFRALELPHTLIPDTALGWLLAQRTLDALLFRAETICANGDVVATLGSLAVAQLGRAAGVPVLACAPLSAFDARTSDAGALPAAPHIAARAMTYAGDRLDPASDVVPAKLLDGVLCDEGLLRHPLGDALANAAARAGERHWAGQPASAG